MSSRRTQLRWPENPVEADRYAHTFDQSWAYDALGNVVSTVYPICITTPQNGRKYCNDPADQQAPSHTVTRTMNHGLPVRVSTDLGISADYQYHWNYQLKRIDYSNQTHTDLAMGTNGMQRPASISHYGANGSLLFDTGTYQYDAAGNIWAIGADRYVYDGASRLRRGTAGSASRWETYAYGFKDNLTRVQRDGGSPALFNIDGKNRLVGNAGSPPDTVYDGAGNVDLVGSLQNPLFDLQHDSLNMVSTVATQFPAVAEEYHTYGPGNYRLLSYNALTGERFWTLRDQGGKILREHRVAGWGPYQSAAVPGERWTFTKDHVYGPNGTLATRDAAAANRFFHTDHLGSPRLITDTRGEEVGRHTYYPFGGEASVSGVDERAAKFTGHELDRHGNTYYMLARSYVPLWLRFAQIDPARAGWNLYSYASNNPIGRIDPDGRLDEPIADPEAVRPTLGAEVLRTMATGARVGSQLEALAELTTDAQSARSAATTAVNLAEASMARSAVDHGTLTVTSALDNMDQAVTRIRSAASLESQAAKAARAARVASRINSASNVATTVIDSAFAFVQSVTANQTQQIVNGALPGNPEAAAFARTRNLAAFREAIRPLGDAGLCAVFCHQDAPLAPIRSQGN